MDELVAAVELLGVWADAVVPWIPILAVAVPAAITAFLTYEAWRRKV